MPGNNHTRMIALPSDITQKIRALSPLEQSSLESYVNTYCTRFRKDEEQFRANAASIEVLSRNTTKDNKFILSFVEHLIFEWFAEHGLSLF